MRKSEDKRLWLVRVLMVLFTFHSSLITSSAQEDPEYRLEIDLKPALDEKKLDARILRDFQKYSNREIKNALNDLAASSMIPVLIELSGIPEDTKVNSITKEQREKLRDLFKRFPVSI